MSLDMEDKTPRSERDAALVRYLKWLVTALSVTMIVGFIVLVTVVVMRFNADTAPTAWPEEIALPEGATISAITRGPDFLVVVSDDGRVLVYSPDGQTLRQEIAVAQ